MLVVGHCLDGGFSVALVDEPLQAEELDIILCDIDGVLPHLLARQHVRGEHLRRLFLCRDHRQDGLVRLPHVEEVGAECRQPALFFLMIVMGRCDPTALHTVVAPCPGWQVRHFVLLNLLTSGRTRGLDHLRHTSLLLVFSLPLLGGHSRAHQLLSGWRRTVRRSYGHCAGRGKLGSGPWLLLPPLPAGGLRLASSMTGDSSISGLPLVFGTTHVSNTYTPFCS